MFYFIINVDLMVLTLTVGQWTLKIDNISCLKSVLEVNRLHVNSISLFCNIKKRDGVCQMLRTVTFWR